MAIVREGWKPFSRGSGYESYRYVQVNFGQLTLVSKLLLTYVNTAGLSANQLNLPTAIQLQSSTDGLAFQTGPIVSSNIHTVTSLNQSSPTLTGQ